MAYLEVKELVDGRWEPVPVESVKGMTLGEALDSWYGKEVVMRFDHAGVKGIACGMRKWADYYKGRGHNVFSFRSMRDELDRMGKGCILGEKMFLDCYAEVFGGGVLRINF